MLKTFVVEPTAKPLGTVIWMHGLGASNRDFEDVVPLLDTPYLRFVFPAAPVRAVTINGGMRMPAWYDILSFSDPPLRERAEDVASAAEQVSELIALENARGVESNRIVLAGFSQGAAMALHCALRHPEPLAGALVLSGYLLQPDHFEAQRRPENAQTPFLFCHGSFDPTVPLALGKQAHVRLENAGYSSTFRDYPMQHSLCEPEIEAIADWLSQLFDGR